MDDVAMFFVIVGCLLIVLSGISALHRQKGEIENGIAYLHTAVFGCVWLLLAILIELTAIAQRLPPPAH